MLMMLAHSGCGVFASQQNSQLMLMMLFLGVARTGWASKVPADAVDARR